MLTVVDGLPSNTLSVKLPSAATVSVEEGDGAPSAFAPQFSQPSNTAVDAPSAFQACDGAADTVQLPLSSTAALLIFPPAFTPVSVPIVLPGAETQAIPAPAKAAGR